MSGAKASNASKGQHIRTLGATRVSRRQDRLPLRGTFGSAQFVRVHRLTPRIVMRTGESKTDLPLSFLRRIISLIAPRSEARNLRKIGEYTRRGNVASSDIYFHVKRSPPRRRHRPLHMRTMTPDPGRFGLTVPGIHSRIWPTHRLQPWDML
ncbi:hypothetical protein ACNHE5_14530 [Pandoraea pnomenusa]|uniref:hypothetical protein n=1 Tax=Pandoraea pnomenusa TaxID=93220 RepID=UPI003CFACA39